jgi:molecular chaperone DnaK
MAVSVGIDLGTTFCAVAYIDPQSKLPQIIPNREGKRITPSVIQFLDGQPVFGSEAESAFIAGEPGCAATFKREMGKQGTYCVIDGKSYTAEVLSALLLRHLKEDAEAELGDSIKDAVITVPAYFYSTEREATIRAATAAGLKVKKIIDEPNAAAMAYGLNYWRENANILVYDLGGGTFDVTLIRMGRNGNLSTITTRGDHMLGGRDWDDRIETLLLNKFADETGLDIHSDTATKIKLRGMSEGIKRQLSVMQSVKATALISSFGSATVSISRSEFEENSSDLLERTGDLCKAVLMEAELGPKDVTDVLLVGGSTRMPQVSRFLLGIFGKNPITHVHPDEAVALGAAIQSTKEDEPYVSLSMQITSDGKKVTDRKASGLRSHVSVMPSYKLSGVDMLTLRETTAHAMGIIAINDDGNSYYNDIIIPANHPRPVRFAKKFTYYTSSDSRNELEIYLLQGDSEKPLDCIIPYKYVVTGIRHIPRGEILGTLMRVQYSYDHNGIIRVQARQEDDTVDLPIRQDEVPVDMSRFGMPVKQETSDAPGLFQTQPGPMTNQDVVHRIKDVTFSNVKWIPYDHIKQHPSGAEYNEPKVHVIAVQKAIEFHGYNISEMNEGVDYTIGAKDDFIIECEVNTSDIQPHPGGCVDIVLGIITANLNQYGGDIKLDGVTVASVGAKFKLRMFVTNGGQYGIYVDDKPAGSKQKIGVGYIEIRFGFRHDSHNCHILSHAYISDILMYHCEYKKKNTRSDAVNDIADTWND